MTKEIQVENVSDTNPTKSHKKTKFVLGLIFDAIGMLSYAVPGFAETIDVVWAPISGWSILVFRRSYSWN